MSSTLAGRVAVVTGAAGGLGAAIGDVLEREEASVLRVDLRGEGCFHADVGTGEGNRAMIGEALARHGLLDTLVLKAGLQHMAPLEEFREPEWDRLFNVMVKGPFLAMKAAWPHFVESGRGGIIVTAFAPLIRAEEYKAAYVSGKHAFLGLIKVVALEGVPD